MMNEQFPQNERTEEKQTRRNASDRMRRRLILLISITLGVLLLCLGVVLLIGKLTEGGKTPGYEEGDYTFCPTYEGDILQYKAYLDLDRSVYHCDDINGYGPTVSIEADNREDFDAAALFLYEYLQIVIRGDEDAYNALFNDRYYESAEPKDPFTPQMVYEAYLYFGGRRTDSNGDEVVTYRMKYKLFENDGSFRRDVGSDMSRLQEITLRITPSGEISIESLVGFFRG